MTTDPRAALDRLIGALEAHLDAARSRRGEADPVVVSAYQNLADAFEAYDEALYVAYDEVTPFVLYDDSEDDLEDDDLDDEADEEGDDEADEEGDDDDPFDDQVDVDELDDEGDGDEDDEDEDEEEEDDDVLPDVPDPSPAR